MRRKFKRFAAIVLCLVMALSCMPTGVLAEAATPTDLLLPEEPEPDTRFPIQAALDEYGHVYATTIGETRVYATPDMTDSSLVYITTKDICLVLATAFTQSNAVMVWFHDGDGNVVSGYVHASDLDDSFLLDEDISQIDFFTVSEGMTSIGLMPLFVVNGTYPLTESELPVIVDPVITAGAEPTKEADETASPDEPTESTPESTETPKPEEIVGTDEPVGTDELTEPTPESTETPISEEVLGTNEPVGADEPTEPMSESTETPKPEEILGTDEIVGADEPTEPTPECTETPKPEEVPTAEDAVLPQQTASDDQHIGSLLAVPGDYISVTTATRVLSQIDEYAAEDTYCDAYLGHFVNNATVQVLSTEVDCHGNGWYEVRFLYGDDFSDGRMKWTDYSTAWVLAAETGQADTDSCTVTDFAFTREFLRQAKQMNLHMAATAMDGFTLKNISGSVGGFYSGQSSLYGSSGRDRDYPQIAKSAAHGTVYATPHFLEGFPVFCLEHNLSGPGEGSGASQSAKGPYALVDMDTFVNNPDSGGVTGVRYKATTMHALGWVLRHTYPFMALDRNDAHNEVWSRVAGQFAVREVIKQLEGPQYVRSYWDMDSFYAFSGGAPAVYLTYARWLAANGIARASITGNITASNQSLSVSGSSYIGTVTLSTDADLIRIPKSAYTLTGNSGGSDSSYYYIKSGDTIKIASSESQFAVSMESVSSSDEEANFLVGIPSVSIQKVLVPTYGVPYALKSGSVTFELSLGQIVVTKKSSDGLLLQGTVFELLNSSGTVLATATTAANGEATFASLQPGSYTVREKSPSQGYKLSTPSTQTISVVAGVTSTATFTNNRIMGRIQIVKTDGQTNKPLAGATFTVTRLSGPESDNASDIGKVVATITTNAQGIAETGLLPWGEYRVVETGVPDGYIDSGYSVTTWIK